MARLDLGDLPGDDLRTILHSLPSSDEYRRLYQAFKSRIHPVIPICHLPSLERTTMMFWNENAIRNSGETLALILSVAYCGLVCISDERYADMTRSISESYDRLLHALSFPDNISNATVPLLQSYLLTKTCKARQLEPLSSFGFLSPAVRVAQALKLNFERKSLSPVEKEVQRRVWWHLIYMDMEATLMSGLPLLIHEDDFTTLMPSQFDDACITDDGQEPSIPPQPVRTKSPMMLAMHGRWHWAMQLRKWRRKMRPIGRDFEEYERTMEHILSEMPPEGENDWSRSYVRLHIERAVCSAARGFLKGMPISSIGCDHKLLRYVLNKWRRASLIEHRSCLRFLKEYINQARLCSQNGFQWFLPGFVHPLQAMMILLLHLTICSDLHYEESRHSNSILADIFELVGNRLQQGWLVSSTVDTIGFPDSSDKADLIYCLLAKLRYRVWKRAAWLDSFPQGDHGCPIEDLTEAIKFARPWKLQEQESRTSSAPSNSEMVPRLRGTLSTELLDETDWNQCDDLFDQFLQPGVLA